MHKAEIISVEELADGAIAIHARCCQDPSTDSVHTIYHLHEKETLDIQREANDHVANVEQKHMAKKRAKDAIALLMPKKP